MTYEQSEAQKQFLRKKYAQEREEEIDCHCRGNVHCPRTNNPCKGFVRNCKCEDNLDAFRTARRTIRPLR